MGRENKMNIGVIGILMLLIASSILLLTPQAESKKPDKILNYNDSITKYQEISYNYTDAIDDINDDNTYSIQIGKITYDLNLYKNRFFKNSKGSTLEGIECYYGHVKNEFTSVVRLTLSENYISGFISKLNETIYIEPKRNTMVDTKGNTMISYKTSDVDLSLNLGNDTVREEISRDLTSISSSNLESSIRVTNTTMRTL